MEETIYSFKFQLYISDQLVKIKKKKPGLQNTEYMKLAKKKYDKNIKPYITKLNV